MSESGSSSSAWPTPDSGLFNDGEDLASFRERQARQKAKGINGNGMGLPLAMAAKAWPTPNAGNGGPDLEHRDTGAPNSTLETAVSLWPTPQSRDGKGTTRENPLDHNARPLNEVVAHWYTPSVPNGGRVLGEGTSPTGITPDGQKRQVGLENQARWASPRVSAGGYTRDNGDPTKERPTLEGLASNWPTPTSLSFDGSHQPGNSASMNRTMELASSLPVPATEEPGPTSQMSIPAGSRPSLNPRFVEWLMGWPDGWTAFACSATALCLWKRRMRFALSQLTSRRAPPAQLSLFA